VASPEWHQPLSGQQGLAFVHEFEPAVDHLFPVMMFRHLHAEQR